MSDLNAEFEERLVEVEAYLDLLLTIETQAQLGPPKIQGAETSITTQQQQILYAGVYLQLYNLVESTMTRCIAAVEAATRLSGSWKPSDLSEELRREWVKVTARTHVVDMAPDRRLQNALLLCDTLIASLPISSFDIEKGGGGNWDDSEIEAFSRRLGCALVVSQPVYRDVKRPFRDDLGPLALVKQLRNRLAHGSISFAQSAENITVARLVELKDKTVNYLREVVACFSNYIGGFEYIIPEKRPA